LSWIRSKFLSFCSVFSEYLINLQKKISRSVNGAGKEARKGRESERRDREGAGKTRVRRRRDHTACVSLGKVRVSKDQNGDGKKKCFFSLLVAF